MPRSRIFAYGKFRHDSVGVQIEKLVPQPQEAVACGFLILKEAPIRSSTKSISEPARIVERDRVDQHAGARPLDHARHRRRGRRPGRICMEAGAAAALDADAQHGMLGPRRRRSRRSAGRRAR